MVGCMPICMKHSIQGKKNNFINSIIRGKIGGLLRE